ASSPPSWSDPPCAGWHPLRRAAQRAVDHHELADVVQRKHPLQAMIPHHRDRATVAVAELRQRAFDELTWLGRPEVAVHDFVHQNVLAVTGHGADETVPRENAHQLSV